MAEKRKPVEEQPRARGPVKEVDIHVPSGTLSLSIGRWGPFDVEHGKARIPVEAIPAAQTNGYRIVQNELGKAYAEQREARRARRLGVLRTPVETDQRDETTPPLDADHLAEIREREVSMTEEETWEEDK
jgi:hypothetical protein